LKIINWHFLVTSKSTVLKGLCQSDLFVKTKKKKVKKSNQFCSHLTIMTLRVIIAYGAII